LHSEVEWNTAETPESGCLRTATSKAVSGFSTKQGDDEKPLSAVQLEKPNKATMVTRYPDLQVAMLKNAVTALRIIQKMPERQIVKQAA